MRGTIFKDIAASGLVSLALLSVLAAPAYADVTPSSVSWAALEAGNDFTGQILDSLFPMDGATQTTTGLMLEWFTAYVGMIAAVWLFYSTIIQIHKTAESGKILSASFSGWVPIRVIGAIIMMAPVSTNGGYSLGQDLIIKTAKVSIGMGRTLKDIVIDSVGPKALPLSAPIIPGSRQIVQGVINSELCRSLINIAGNNSNLVPAPEVSIGTKEAFRVTVSYDMAQGDAQAIPACGKISMAATGQVSAQLSLATTQKSLSTIDFSAEGNMRVAALKQLISNIRPNTDRIAKTLWETRDVTVLNTLNSVFTGQSQYFSGRLTAISSSAIAKIRAAGSNNGSEDSGIVFMKNLGWTGLGAYYLEISRLNAEVQAVSAITPSVQKPSWAGVGGYLSSDLAPFLLSITGYMAKQDEMLVTTDQSYAPSASPQLFANSVVSQDVPGVLDKVLRYTGLSEKTFVTIMNYLVIPSAGTGWTDPLSNMLGLGHFLIMLALTIIGASAIASSSSASAAAGVVSLATGNFGAAAAAAAAATFTGVVTALLVPLFTAAFMLMAPGVTLAYILPMTPCLFWYAGVAGWLVLVVEAMAAAPLWFLAHMTFAGDGIHGKGIRGYEILFTILFRPSMMVVGMICSYTIFSGMSWIIMKSFVIACGFVFDNGYLVDNFIGILVLMGLYVTLEMTTATLSFRLISTLPHHLPDMVGFRSIGRVDADAFVQNSQDPVKKGVDTASEATKSVVKNTSDNSSQGSGGGGKQNENGTPKMDSNTKAQMDEAPVVEV